MKSWQIKIRSNQQSIVEEQVEFCEMKNTMLFLSKIGVILAYFCLLGSIGSIGKGEAKLVTLGWWLTIALFRLLLKIRAHILLKKKNVTSLGRFYFDSYRSALGFWALMLLPSVLLRGATVGPQAAGAAIGGGIIVSLGVLFSLDIPFRLFRKYLRNSNQEPFPSLPPAISEKKEVFAFLGKPNIGWALFLFLFIGALIFDLIPAKKGSNNNELSAAQENNGQTSSQTDFAIDELKAKAEDGNARAQVELGFKYYYGNGVPKNHTEAARWISKAAQQGDVGGEFALAGLYNRGEGVVKDVVEEGKWLTKASQHGDKMAQFILARMLVTGEGMAEDKVEAYKWLVLSSAQGMKEAIKERDTILKDLKPEEIAEGQKRASLFRIQPASQGIEKQADASLEDAQAQYELSIKYYKAKDYTASAQWAQKAVNQGYTPAQSWLAEAYYSGKGVPQDYGRAMALFLKAAEQGDASSQFQIGGMYYFGKGVPKNYVEAAKWNLMAAEQGVDAAQFVLGAMYEKGEGVPKDELEAIRWYTKSAEQGHSGGQFHLGRIYKDGQGVLQDFVEAYKWFSLAAAKDNYNDAEAQCKKLAPSMTAEQLEEARQRAAAFVPKKNPK